MPLPVETQVLIIYAATNGYVDQIAGRDAAAATSTSSSASSNAQARGLQDASARRSSSTTTSRRLVNTALEEFKAQFTA